LASKTPTTSSSLNETKKLQRAEDGAKAMAEYEAAALATQEKTERLRALRLAKEAVEGVAPAVKTPGVRIAGSRTGARTSPAKVSATKPAGAKTPAQKASKSKPKAKSLTDFLNTESGSGRRS
jgi:hypothetical protein